MARWGQRRDAAMPDPPHEKRAARSTHWSSWYGITADKSTRVSHHHCYLSQSMEPPQEPLALTGWKPRRRIGGEARKRGCGCGVGERARWN